MGKGKRARRSNFWIKLKSWEYWPFELVYIPVFVYWLFLSIRAKSLFFFSASNPTIVNGGMFGESKFDILSLIPDAYKPLTIRVDPASPLEMGKVKVSFTFPLIAKPDIGERGRAVKKIPNESELERYHANSNYPYLIQEYVDLPFECGVFYYRMPNATKGVVSSIVVKEFLSLTGDGQTSVLGLMERNDRASLQIERMRAEGMDMERVLAKGEKEQIVPIGNHCLGTKFLNGNDYITKELTTKFDEISAQIPGFYYGRYDLRAADIAALNKGEISIMELNGAGAEPAHIYNPGFSLFQAYRVLLKHWSVLFSISRANHLAGHPYLSFKEGKKVYREYKKVVEG